MAGEISPKLVRVLVNRRQAKVPWQFVFCISLPAQRNVTFLGQKPSSLLPPVLGFVQLFNNPPTVAISPIGFTPWISSISGNPEIPSYMPFYLMKMRPPFSLWEKLINQLLDRYNDVYYK